MKGLPMVMERNDVQVTVRVNKDIKERAEQLFDSIGLSMSAAINVFLRKSLDENGIPFALTTKQTGFGAGHSAEEITEAFNGALQKDFMHSRENGLPIARYDEETEEAYLEFPDGSRKYGAD